MSSRFLVSVEPPETRVAEVRDGELVAFYLERDRRLVGDIFRGVVRDIVPGMDAAFIALGVGRNALLYAGDLPSQNAFHADPNAPTPPIGQLLKPGQAVTVQVAKPPVGDKGPRVTARLSLPGRFVVLMSDSDSLGVSRRIESDDERNRLRKFAERHRPLDCGLIVRTEAEGATEPDLAADIRALELQLRDIKARAQLAPAPSRLHRDLGLLARLARDRFGPDLELVEVDHAPTMELFASHLSEQMPAFAPRLHHYDDSVPLFARYNVADSIARAFERVVPLPSGGAIVIDEAEALVAIDVNTGRFTSRARLADTVLQTNLEAVEEAARQMRLRDLGGVIIIDLIDMERARDRVKVLNALEAALKLDRTKTRIVQLSPLGLVELTRHREGQSLRHQVTRACSSCGGTGAQDSPHTLAIGARRELRALAKRLPTSETPAPVTLTLSPELALAMALESDELLALERETNLSVHLRVDVALSLSSSRTEVGLTPHETLCAGQLRHLAPNEWLAHKSVRAARLGDRLAMIDDAPAHDVAVTLELREVGRWFSRARAVGETS